MQHCADTPQEEAHNQEEAPKQLQISPCHAMMSSLSRFSGSSWKRAQAQEAQHGGRSELFQKPMYRIRLKFTSSALSLKGP